MPDWGDVVAIGHRYPGVEEATWFGTLALKVAGKSMCRRRTDPDALVMRLLDLSDREALLKGQPDVFFSTPHYDASPYVLVRLDAIHPQQLTELVEDAWRIRPKRVVAEYDAGG